MEVFLLCIFFCGICVCLCDTVMSVSCSLVVINLERAELLALGLFPCIFSLSQMMSWVRCGT